MSPEQVKVMVLTSVVEKLRDDKLNLAKSVESAYKRGKKGGVHHNQ